MVTPLVAAILFAAPGPVERKTFADATVRAQVVYRIAHDRQYDTGPAAVSPSIAVGRLTYLFRGRRRDDDLAQVLPIRDDRVLLPDGPSDGCGAVRAIQRRGAFLVIEWILAQKGCAPMATFIDLATGRVARSAVLDWTWDHRLDVVPAHFTTATATIDSATIVDLTQATWSKVNAQEPTFAPWSFALIRWHRDATEGLIAVPYPVESPYRSGKSGRAILPRRGEGIEIGSVHVPWLYYGGETIVRLDSAANAAYASRQPPVSARAERIARRNEWFEIAERAGATGDLAGATTALAKARARDDNADIAAGDSALLARCRALVASGSLRRASRTVRAAAWQNGCSASR